MKPVCTPRKSRVVKAVIADWSGTLVDRYCLMPVTSIRNSFFQYKLDIPDEEIRKYMGLPKHDHISYILFNEYGTTAFKKMYGRSPNDFDRAKICKTFDIQMMRELADKRSHLFQLIPHVEEALNHLKCIGIKIGVTTGFNSATSAKIVEMLAVNGIHIDTHVGSDSVVNGSRPNPAMFYKCMENLGITDINSVVKLGDSDLDIREGVNAGCTTIGVYGYSTHMNISFPDLATLSEDQLNLRKLKAKHVLDYAGADYLINNLSDLGRVIRAINRV